MSSPFLLLIGFFSLFSVLFLVRWAVARHQLTREAAEEFETRKASRPVSVKGVEAETFKSVYVAAHEPRWALYASAALAAALALTYPAVLVLTNLWSWGYAALGLEASGDQPWFDVGYYPWMFYMFFGLVAVWALTGAVAARLHHRRAPEAFNAALARARGEPLDDVVIPRQRPKWSPLRGQRPAAPKPSTPVASDQDATSEKDE